MPLNVYLQTVVVRNVPETINSLPAPQEYVSRLDLGTHEGNRRSQNDKL